MEFKLIDESACAPCVHEVGEVFWLSSPLLDSLGWVVNGTSTRLGGVSSGYASAMNFCVNEYDTVGNVLKNREILFDAVGIDGRDFVFSRQVHKTDIAVVDEEMLALSMSERQDANGEIDGLITNVPGATLGCFSADCCIVSIADPANRAVGIAHAGWRGTVAKIAAKALAMMGERYGTNPADVVASLSPSICKECFEVGEDVVQAARDAFDEDAWPAIFTPHSNGDGKYQFDIWEANAQVLVDAGVRRERIEKPNVCTCCNPGILFSHRATQGRRGTIMTFIGIRE